MLGQALAWLFFFAAPLLAHMASMSTGELRIDGASALYEFRIPLHDLPPIDNPEQAIFDSIRFKGARLVGKSCRQDDSTSEYVCTARYEFLTAPDAIKVESHLHQITDPGHVHMLRATRNGKTERAVLDRSSPSAELRFRRPTPLEAAMRQATEGAMRAATGCAQLLFLMGLVLAAHTRKELWSLAAMFLLGEVATAVVAPQTSWHPSPRFIEAACALTVAYLALEILLLPAAGCRSIVVGILGIFHGLYFAGFLRTGNYSAGYVLTGAVAVEVGVLGLLITLKTWGQKTRRLAAAIHAAPGALLAAGLVWFAVRLGG